MKLFLLDIGVIFHYVLQIFTLHSVKRQARQVYAAEQRVIQQSIIIGIQILNKKKESYGVELTASQSLIIQLQNIFHVQFHFMFNFIVEAA